MSGGASIVLDLRADRAVALRGRAEGGGVVVEGWAEATVPSGVSASDASAYGAWLRGVLEEKGLLGKRGLLGATPAAIVAVPRGDAVLKWIELPGGKTPDARDVHEIVRLAIGRQPALGESAVFDFEPPSQGPGGAVGVRAAAVSGERVAWLRGVCRTAGLRVASMRLTGLGVAAAATAFAEGAAGVAGTRLIVAMAPGGVEIVVARDGRPAFVRGVDVSTGGGSGGAPGGAEGEAESFAKRVAVEASRTWMGYRLAPGGGEVDGAVVLGWDERARAVAEALGGQLELSVRTLGASAAGSVVEQVPAERVSEALPLAGLLLVRRDDAEALDFANVSTPPDPRARLRQIGLAAALALVVVGGGGVVGIDRAMRPLRGEITRLVAEEKEVRARYVQAVVETARVRHAEAFASGGFDWSAHLQRLLNELPDPPEATLNQVVAVGDQQVTFTPGKRAEEAAAWGVERGASFRLIGSMRSREPIAALRERLLADEVYRVVSRGAEVSDAFDVELRTSVLAPPVEGEGSGGAGSGGNGAKGDTR